VKALDGIDRAWKRVIALPGIRVVHQVHDRYEDDRGSYLSASITYYLIVAVIPFALVALAIAGFLLKGLGVEQAAALLTKVARDLPGMQAIVTDNIDSLVQGRGWAGGLAVLGLLWAGTGGLAAIRNALSAIFRYNHRELPGLLVRAQGLAILGLLMLSILAVTVVLALATALGWLGTAATLAIGTVLGMGVVVALFLVFVPRAVASVRQLIPGALVAGAGIAVLAVGGSFYASRIVSKLNVIYGTFAVFVGTLVLFNLIAVVLLHGAEYSAWRMEESRREANASDDT